MFPRVVHLFFREGLLQDHRDHRGLKVHKEPKAQSEPKDHKEIKALPGLKDPKGLKA